MAVTDWFLLTLTFFTGLFIGAFIYITSFQPVYAPVGIEGTEDAAYAFSITGRAYGGMRTNYVHPTVRVLKDGSFTYKPGHETGGAGETIEAILPRGIRNELVDQALSAQLAAYAAPASKTCRVDVDGIDYTYRIVIDGTVYQLDSCTTALPYESDFNQALETMWQYLQDPRSYRAGDQSKTLQEAASEWLNEQIGVDGGDE